MAIKGSLREAGLAEVCQLLSLGLKTGSLSVTDRSRFGQIYFERGRITYARIVNRRTRLGYLLVRDGVLSQDDLDDVLRVQSADPDVPLGQLLVDRGFIDAEGLTSYLRKQIEEAIYHLFTWSRGSFYFEAGETPRRGDILVSISPESLLLEAARRVDEWSTIEKRIPSLDLVFQLDRDALAAAGLMLSREQERIVALLDGTYSVQAIADETGILEFDVGKALYGLLQAGVAERVGRQGEEPEHARDGEVGERLNLGLAFLRTGMLEDAAREFRRVLELDPREQLAAFHLAVITLREGRFRDALREFMALIERGGAHFASFVNLAVALRSLGHHGDALLALDEAEKLRPGAADVALARAIVHVETRALTAAETAFADYRERLGATRKPSPVYYYSAALTAALAGATARALEIVTEGREAHAHSPPLLLLSGLLHERRGDLDGARHLYRRVVEMDPALVQAQKSLGDVAYAQGSDEEALRLFQRASELEPDLGDDLYTKLGNLHYKSRNREGAVRYWTRALDLNPNNGVVRNNLEIVAHAGA